MTELNATIYLRPTHIGFLVRPNDLASIKRIAAASTCVWGGILNPMIPVFRTQPLEWQRDDIERAQGIEITKGYIRFFEPDVYVETKAGLLEKAGLGALRQKHSFHPLVLTLDEFLEPNHHDDIEPNFGLNIFDLLRHLYTTERRFQFREDAAAISVPPNRSDGLAEVVFGTYPKAPGLGRVLINRA